LVDEVLAVGDAQFQKKCFSKMRQIRNQGKTIVLVSHNMAAVRSICNQGLHLQDGRAVIQTDVNQVVDAYLARTETADGPMEVETESFVVNEVLIESSSSPILKTFAPCEIRVRFQAKIDVGDPGVYIGFLTNELHRLAGLDLKDFTSLPPLRAGQSAEIGFRVESLPFLAGSYQVEVHLKDMSRPLIERIPRYYRFDVAETPVYGGRHLDSWFGNVGLTATPITRV